MIANWLFAILHTHIYIYIYIRIHIYIYIYIYLNISDNLIILVPKVSLIYNIKFQTINIELYAVRLEQRELTRQTYGDPGRHQWLQCPGGWCTVGCGNRTAHRDLRPVQNPLVSRLSLHLHSLQSSVHCPGMT